MMDWNTWGGDVEQEQNERAFQNNASRAWGQEEKPGLRQRDLELGVLEGPFLCQRVLQRPALRERELALREGLM